MTYFYKVYAKFAKAGAPSLYTKGYKELFEDAKKHFNSRALVSTNPREIKELNILNEKTFEIIFESKSKLNINHISRSLRPFTSYLIDEKKSFNLRHLISGRRLFRMIGEETKEKTMMQENKFARSLSSGNNAVSSLKLLLINANGQSNKNAILQPFIADEIINKNPDVFVSVEFVKGKNWLEFIYSFPQYNIITSPNTTGNGVLIGIKKEIQLTNIIEKIPAVSTYYSPDFLQVGIKCNGQNLNIIGTRIKTLNVKKEIWDDDYKYRRKQFENLTNYLSDIQNNTIVLGDFNNSFIRGDQTKIYTYEEIQKLYKRNKKGETLATRHFNYHLMKNMLGGQYVLHTPKKGSSWGLQLKNGKLTYGYIKNDHLITNKDNIKVNNICYNWDYIKKNQNKSYIKNIYFNENFKSKDKENNNTLWPPNGYPDHAMLLAEIEI